MNNTTIAKNFHNYLDAELGFKEKEKELPKAPPIIITEHELGYRFYPHFHPYVGQLVQRLLQGSTSSLQAADTEYVPDGTALPGSIEIALDSNAGLLIPSGSQVVLLGDLEAYLYSDFEGELTPIGPILLSANSQMKVAPESWATLPDGMRVTLLDEMNKMPSVGDKVKVAQPLLAVVSGDTTISLPSGVKFTLSDSEQASVPVETKVRLLGGTQLTIPNGTEVTLLSSKPRPELYAPIFSSTRYSPSKVVQLPYPVKDLDFSASGAYSVYNWELFFHVPLTIAIHLSKNQRFAEAQRWFHYVFDPTDDSDGPTPERFWKVRPFQYTDVKKIEEILVNLATGADRTLRDETIHSIEAWADAPFRPHVVARYRQPAYMYKTVMAYLDNLIAWGDSLFRQDTGESIDEALMLYVLAANILGPRSQPVPKKGAVRPQTYANLKADLDKFGNAMRDAEAEVPGDLMPLPADAAADNDQLATLRSLGTALYFCVPRNDKLMSYWDTVADRLFKIRNSLNIQGIFRQLPLFAPPIDPAMLARAAAAGLDVGAVVSGLNQPLPLVRFQLLVQRAAEICQEVKALGNNLLSAMEKEEGEALAILRAKHERIVMEMVKHVRYAQVQEAIKSKEGLLKSLAVAVQRYAYYERQLGNTTEMIEKSIPELAELDKDSLDNMKFAMTEPEMAPRAIEVDIATDAFAQAAQVLYGGKLQSSHEVRESLSLEFAQASSDVANVLGIISSGTHLIPTAKIHLQPWGLGGTIEYGGKEVGSSFGGAASAARAIAERLNFEARRAGRIDSFARREREWAFQSNLAVGEITQIFKQLRAAQIREAISELELKNHSQQIKHAEEIEHFLNEEGTEKNGKKTNKALYAWMKREVKGLYAQCFQFAFDVAKKAERALQHELGNPELSYLQFGYLAGNEGLLAGEKLYLDIKRMGMAYDDLNQREYELTKHVSLLQVNPLALLQLRTTGRCAVILPEELFDWDGPGHYFRRIKSVAVSIPCVAGPYTSVNCTLTLLKSSIRKTQMLRGGIYEREDAEDDRFSDYFGSIQSIVTSSGQNDSGLFETNLRDERYLPFEGSGAVSEWQLQLPADPSKGDPRQFDYDTISDVILHLRYTAREGGSLLRTGAVTNLATRIDEAQTVGSMRLFSVRHEFPTEWAKFKSIKVGGATTAAELALKIQNKHFPFWSQGRLKAIKQVELFAEKAEPGTGIETLTPSGSAEITTHKSDGKEDKETVTDLTKNIILPQPPNTFTVTFTLSFEDNLMEDLWLALNWGKED
jgi:hypothetical protein